MSSRKIFKNRCKTHPSSVLQALPIWQGRYSSWRADSFSKPSRKGRVSRKTLGLVITLRGSNIKICSRIQSLRQQRATVIQTRNSQSPSIEATFVHWDAQRVRTWSRTWFGSRSTSRRHFLSNGIVMFRRRMVLRCTGISSLGRLSRPLGLGK